LFKQSSPFLIETMEVSIRKPGNPQVATGPFKLSDNATEFRGNPDYDLGPPTIDRVTVTGYPNVRAAWAEMLRDKLDMLWEVGPEALTSLERSSTISTFTYTRHYQYVLAMNAENPALRAPEVRRAMNAAIDR